MKTLHRILMLTLCLAVVSLAQTDRTKKPESQKTPTLKLPSIQRAKLSNGLSIMLVEHHEIPVVQFQLVLRSGSSLDPAGKSGVAMLTAQMADEGTAKRDALKIADDLDFIGANLSVGSSDDATFAAVLTIKEHLAAAMDIYADVVQNASFPATEWDRIKKSHLASLLSQKDQPASVASNVFAKITYGADHPYGNPSQGTETSVGAITLDELKSFYQAHYVPNNGTLIVVGDVTMKEIKPMIERHLGGWKKGPVLAPTFSKAPSVEATRIYLVDKPEAAQSEIRIGHVGVPRSTKDYFALTVLNTILGGQFSSRINMNLRETKGYTYGARSSFVMIKEAGPFVASSAVRTNVTDSSVIEFMNELRKIVAEDVTAQELEFAKNSLVRRQAQSFETPGQIAGQLMSLVLYNLPDSYFGGYVQEFEKVTVADVRKAARAYVHPEKSNIVIVGDVASIRGGLEQLGYGAAKILSPDGVMIQ
jgi:predicted Zn-dependent peptidase